MRTSRGGGGGGGVVGKFGHPGGGGQKGQIFADVLSGWPLSFPAATLSQRVLSSQQDC